MTTTAEELRQALIAAWPPGLHERIDWDGDPGNHLLAISETLLAKAVTPVDELAANSCPLTATSARLVDWERALGLSASRTARFGTLDARRRAVIARLREYGPPTIAMIQSVVAPLLDYADPSQLVILEADRTALRDAHTYVGTLASATADMVAVYTFRVFDDGRLSPTGLQLDITLTHGDLSKINVYVVSPTGESATVSDIGRGAVSGDTIRVSIPAMTAASVMGLWLVEVSASSGAGTVDAVEAFVEGWGRDSAGNPGLSAAKFEYGVVYEPDKSSGAPDVNAARAAIARITYATRIGALILRELDGNLAAGEYTFLPDDDNAIPDAIVPD